MTYVSSRVWVKRTIYYRGDPEWLDSVLHKSMRLGVTNTFGKDPNSPWTPLRTIRVETEDRGVEYSGENAMKDKFTTK
jgi:hypothetical protein